MSFSVLHTMLAFDVHSELLPDHATLVMTHALKHNVRKLIDANARCICLWETKDVFRRHIPDIYLMQ